MNLIQRIAFRPSSYGKWLMPSRLWSLPDAEVFSESHLALTFDDGPHPEVTPFVLEQLNKYQAKATFFVVGENAQRYPELIEQIESEGHSIGNHTHNHLKANKYLANTYALNVEQAEEHLPFTKLFRPPYGRLGRLHEYAIHNSGYRVVMWSLLTLDFVQEELSREFRLKVVNSIIPGDIIVMHDSPKAYKNLVQLLPQMLKHIDDIGARSMALPKDISHWLKPLTLVEDAND